MTFKTSVLCYDGAGDASSAHNGWCKDPQGRLLDGFREACTITGDLSPIARASPVLKTPTGEKFRELDFSIGIFFGGTSLKAALLWTENVSGGSLEQERRADLLSLRRARSAGERLPSLLESVSGCASLCQVSELICDSLQGERSAERRAEALRSEGGEPHSSGSDHGLRSILSPSVCFAPRSSSGCARE